MPAFVPIMFEMTVFFAAHLMVITFYMRSKLWPFKKQRIDPRTTDDHFLMAIDLGHHNADEVTKFWPALEPLKLVSLKMKTITSMKNSFQIVVAIAASVLMVSCFNSSRPNYQYMPNMYEPVGYETYGEYEIFLEVRKPCFLPREPFPEDGNLTNTLIQQTDWIWQKAELKTPFLLQKQVWPMGKSYTIFIVRFAMVWKGMDKVFWYNAKNTGDPKLCGPR